MTSLNFRCGVEETQNGGVISEAEDEQSLGLRPTTLGMHQLVQIKDMLADCMKMQHQATR